MQEKQATSAVERIASRGILDRVGMIVSTACAVHCALLPVIITIAGFGWLGDERFEWAIIATSFAIASLRLFHCYLREHGRTEALMIFGVGAASILLAKSEFLAWNLAEPFFMTIGGLTIAYSHWRNHKIGCANHSH